MKRLCPSIPFLFAYALACSAQSPAPSAAPSPSPSAPAGIQSAAVEKRSVPDSFLGYSLGMGMDELKSALSKDGLLDYRGDPDVSLLPSRKESLVDVQGSSYIKRASFQFVDDKLYVMVFSLDQSKVDYYSVYSSMLGKYGQASSVSPEEISWADDSVRVSLERPLSVKYLDLAAYKALIESGAAEKSLREMRRDEFLDSF